MDLKILILLIIIFICVAFIYKLYGDKNNFMSICRKYIWDDSKRSDYLFLDTSQVLCLPYDFKKQTENLMSEMREAPCTIDDYVSELPESKILLLFSPEKDKKVIGMLKVFLLDDVLFIKSRVINNSRINLNNPIYVASVIIDSDYRGKGFGNKLFDILFRIAKKDIILELKKENKPAFNLYNKVGFEIIGEDDEIYLMRKKIK